LEPQERDINDYSQINKQLMVVTGEFSIEECPGKRVSGEFSRGWGWECMIPG